MSNYSNPVAIGDIGTQVFWWNKKNSGAGTEQNPYVGKFEYAVPVTAGAEFGGDTESFDAPETDLDYVPKIAGRTSLNDVSYTSNYTKEKYARIVEISSNTELQTYMEVLSDGSATLFRGTSGRPTITGGDVRQINWTVVPQFMLWISDIYNLSESEIDKLDEDMYTTTSGVSALNIDVTTIPEERPEYYAATNA